MIFRNPLRKENILLKNSLQNKIVSLNKIIKPAFNFGLVTRKDNPKEYFASSVLNKIYSLNVSTENSLFTNDVFLSIYLYRYVYELYIKTFYIFSGSSEEQILFRLNEFFDNKKWNLKEVLNEIKDSFLPPKFKESHDEKYRSICRFVHPNHESFKLHLNRTDDQQFEFLVPNINLAIWHSVGIIKLFSDAKLLGFDKNINQVDLVSLQKESRILSIFLFASPKFAKRRKPKPAADFSPGHGYFPTRKFRDPSSLAFARSGLAKLRFSPSSARASPSPRLLCPRKIVAGLGFALRRSVFW